MGIAQVGREKVLPPLWPGCPLVCLTEPDDGIRSDRQSGASGIVKPLFCARAMREKGAKEDRAHGAYLRGARTASGESRSRADLHIPKVEMCRGQFFYAPRGPRYVRVNVARTYACGRCSLFSSKPFHSPSSSSNDPQYFAPPLDPVAEWTALCERRAPGWARGRRARHM